MPITNIRAPKWQSADHTLIDLTVDIIQSAGGFNKIIARDAEYTIDASDPIFAEVAGGKYGVPAEFAPRPEDYVRAINAQAQQIMDLPYMGKRNSVNNYFAQLAALKSSGTIKPDQQKDLDGLMLGAAWEQAVVDRRDLLLKTPDKTTFQSATDIKSWPQFPPETAAVVATC